MKIIAWLAPVRDWAWRDVRHIHPELWPSQNPAKPTVPNSSGKLNFGHKTPWVTRGLSLSMSARLEPAVEPLDIVQLSPMLSKGISGVHTKHSFDERTAASHLLQRWPMCQGSKWEVWLWSFLSLQGLKAKPLNTKRLPGLADCYQ